MRFCLISKIITSIALSVFWLANFPLEARALSYSVNMTFDIQVLQNRSAQVTQTVSMKNNSDDFLASSLSIDFPFKKVEHLSVEEGGEPLPATVKQDRLWLDFGENRIDQGESKELTVKYTIANFVVDYGDVKRVKWPKFQTESESFNYAVRFAYPLSWQPVAYSSIQPSSETTVGNTGVVAFAAIDREVDVFLGAHTLKQLNLDVDQTKLISRIGELTFPLRTGIYFLSGNQSASISGGGGSSLSSKAEGAVAGQAKVDLEKYLQARGITIFSRKLSDFVPETQLSNYLGGTGLLTGLDTDQPDKLYIILLSRFNPKQEVSEWQRVDISTSLEKKTQDDLDYANALVALYRSKGIPAQVVYGLAEYPDGNYYWHFWATYLDLADDEAPVWREVDPYLADLTGNDYFSSVPPNRMIWNQLATNSDLSDISSDLFVVTIKDIKLKEFQTVSTETGYITSQINQMGLNTGPTNQSVLGIYDSDDGVIVGFGARIAVTLVGVLLLGIAYFLRNKFEPILTR